jgi:hypothetical protein
MSVQCAAHAVRALAVLPTPASPRRRATCVSISLLPRRPGRVVAPVRAAEPSSPPAAAPAAQPSGASSAGKAIVPDDEFSLAKVRCAAQGPRLSIASLEQGRCGLAVVTSSKSCPLVLNRWSFAGVLRCDWAGSWDLAPVVSSEFFQSYISTEDSECSVIQIKCACIPGMDSARISIFFRARSGQPCC